MVFFFFKQKTAYEMRISDWSSDVCSSDLQRAETTAPGRRLRLLAQLWRGQQQGPELARPVGERDLRRRQAAGAHRGDQGPVAGGGVADLQLRAHRAATFDATQEGEQGRKGPRLNSPN